MRSDTIFRAHRINFTVRFTFEQFAVFFNLILILEGLGSHGDHIFQLSSLKFINLFQGFDLFKQLVVEVVVENGLLINRDSSFHGFLEFGGESKGKWTGRCFLRTNYDV